MNPIQKIELYKDNFTKVDTLIYEWLKKQPNMIIRHPIETLAKETHTSKAAIIRFCKKVGYNGFSEFKFEMSRYIISGERPENETHPLNTIKSITSLYEGYLRQFNDALDISKIKELIKEIKSSKRIKVVGSNRTGLSATQLRLRMSKIGYDAEAITDFVLLSVIQDIMTKDDLIIFFSIYAKNSYYDNFIKEVSKTDAKIVLITMNPHNKIGKLCDYEFILPWISKASTSSFLDDQALFFVFIEILLAELAY
ncbi:MAG: MurR/RpiR family transcriptional regulator [Coprobacillus sp.]